MPIDGDIYGIVTSLQERAAKYAKPARKLPALSEVDELRQSLIKVRNKLNETEIKLAKAEVDNSRLAAALGEAQIKKFAAGLRSPSIAEVKDAFLIALAAENYSVDGAPYREFHLSTPNRSARYAQPRQICMWLCRVITKQPTTIIGRVHGQRDHTTVLHAEQQVRAGKTFTSPMLRAAANRVLAQFDAEVLT